MKFADIEGEDGEAQPGLTGKCRDCGQAMVAKCGQHRVWHWAHSKSKACDPWWEPETEWHRSWKNQFPVAWQEIAHTAQNGERHRADVKTESGLVLEFQYSALSEAERVSREEFYPRLVWVVHANRRLRDRRKFFASLSGPLNAAAWSLQTFSIHRDDSALLRDWGKSRAPVYFDFGRTANHEPVRATEHD
jgi:competence protein CoiA